MNAVFTVKNVIAVTVGAAAVALAGSGCTAVTAGVAMPDKSAVDATSSAGDTASLIDSSDCADVDVQKLEIPAISSAEPRLRIPQPDGWEIGTEFGPDEEPLRFNLVNDRPGAAEGPRNVAMVGLEEVPDMDTEAIFDEGYADMVEGLDEKGLLTDMLMSEGTVCGLPAQTYTTEGSGASMGAAARGEIPAVSLLQVVAETCGRTYLVIVMTFGDDTPAHKRDAETILTGFEVLPSADASI